MLPGLLRELHTLYVTDLAHRADVLRGLMDCYHAAGIMLKNLGVRGLPALAAWLRASTLGGKGRSRMLELSMQGADALSERTVAPTRSGLLVRG